MDREQKFRERLAEIWSENILWNCSLASFTTMGVGGPAKAMIMPDSVDALAKLIKGLSDAGISWYVIGRGSNIIAPDQGVDGVVIVLGKNLGRITIQGSEAEHVLVKVEAGCGLGRLVNWCLDQELSGLEFGVGIPGSVGGCIMMNAGAHGREIGSLVRSLSLVDRQGTISQHIPGADEFSYRQWQAPQKGLVVSAIFELRRGNKKEIEVQCHDYLAARKNGQPKGASAGSVFKNPPGDYAGRLIEAAGLKGLRQGGALVSPVHANFIVNTGTATADDLLTLISLIQARVEEKFSIWLQPEVRVLGE